MKTITIPMTAALLVHDAANASLSLARAESAAQLAAPSTKSDAYALALKLALAEIEIAEHRVKSLRSLVEDEIVKHSLAPRREFDMSEIDAAVRADVKTRRA